MRRALCLVALAACGGEARRAPPPSPPVVARDAGARDAAADAVARPGPDRLALLAGRGDELAPGSRAAIARDLDASKDRDLAVPALDRDACLRAAFDADQELRITLTDARGIVLARADGAAGTLGASGPICLRKGDAATFRFDGQGHVRVVVWETP